jgi:hypothetical protein
VNVKAADLCGSGHCGGQFGARPSVETGCFHGPRWRCLSQPADSMVGAGSVAAAKGVWNALRHPGSE